MTCSHIVAAMMLTTGAVGETPEEQGLAIAREADRRDSGWEDHGARVTMILRNSHGEQSTRELRMQFLEGEGDKSLIVFDKPMDLKGTALLTHTHGMEADDQWLFLPALKRVKRISSNNKAGPFMGSEFAYEDLSAQEVEKYTYRYLYDKMYAGLSCFVVERVPVDKDSGYSRQVVWIDRKEYRVQKVDYYDRKRALYKTLTIKGYRKYLDRYWRADESNMANHQTNKTTDLLWREVIFRQGLTKRDFDRNSLARVR